MISSAAVQKDCTEQFISKIKIIISCAKNAPTVYEILATKCTDIESNSPLSTLY